MTSRAIITRSIFSAVLFACIMLFLWLVCPQYLMYQEQYQLFLFTGEYFLNAISVPGGVADYLSEFAVQFFYVPLYGSIAAALILTLAQVFLGLSCRKCDLADAAYVFAAVPSLFFLGAIGDENTLMSVAVALMLTALFIFLYSLFKNKSIVIDVLLMVIGFAVLYWLAGAFSIVFVAAGGILSRRPLAATVGIVTALFIVWGINTLWFEQYPLERMLMGLNYYRVPEIYPAWLFLIAASTLVAPLVTLVRTTSKKANIAFYVSVVAVAVVAIFYVNESFDEGKSRVLAYDSLVRQGRWEDIIVRAKKERPTDRFSLQAVNLALGMTGQLTENMFQFDQIGMEGLIGRYRLDNTSQLVTAEALYRLGLTNIAFSTTFDLQEAIMNDRKSGRFMKRLAECMLINGNYGVAEKYINMLSNSLYYADWARRAKALVGNDAAVESHPVYGPLRRNAFTQEAFYDYSQIDKIMAILASDNNGGNTLALQYFGASAMLGGNLPALANGYAYLAKQYGQTRIPRHVEEGIALYWTMSHNSFEGIPFAISQEVRQQTVDLAHAAMQNPDNPGAWRNVAPGSYGVYLLGIMRKQSQSAPTQDYHHTHE